MMRSRRSQRQVKPRLHFLVFGPNNDVNVYVLDSCFDRQMKRGKSLKMNLMVVYENSATVEQLGTARKITISKDSTTIIADAASKDEIQSKIKKELSETDSVYDFEKLSERIAKLSGEGIVPGGGAAFVHLSTLVPGIKEKIEDADERLGADITQKNAGIEGEVVVEKVKESEWEMGYNAMTDKYENLVESGVIDPAKV
ncbi:hypothetical protein L2E82_22381 [Cichorium intybus]|uniref:Uncharacterized protein n=1 Tax=Cichorium intybus TaxID=13427 RepID=A0ACB9DYM0_CICIN|nr:hypothetical protein L2E82_22381 [Cichorium intybus]